MVWLAVWDFLTDPWFAPQGSGACEATGSKLQTRIRTAGPSFGRKPNVHQNGPSSGDAPELCIRPSDPRVREFYEPELIDLEEPGQAGCWRCPTRLEGTSTPPATGDAAAAARCRWHGKPHVVQVMPRWLGKQPKNRTMRLQCSPPSKHARLLIVDYSTVC